MVYVYIVIVLILIPVIGKIVNRRSDRFNQQTARWGSMKPFRFTRSSVDPEENPRVVDDGTQYGYKEFD